MFEVCFMESMVGLIVVIMAFFGVGALGVAGAMVWSMQIPDCDSEDDDDEKWTVAEVIEFYMTHKEIPLEIDIWKFYAALCKLAYYEPEMWRTAESDEDREYWEHVSGIIEFIDVHHLLTSRWEAQRTDVDDDVCILELNDTLV